MSKRPRVTGGIVLGWKGRRPMAVTDDPEAEPAYTEPEITYSATPQICGFPWRVSNTSFSIGPLTGPQTGILASELLTTLNGATLSGSRIYLREQYTESVVSDGGGYAWGGAVTGGSAEIVVRDYNDLTNENVVPTLDSGTGVATPAIIMWQIAIVRYVDGEYYLCDSLSPPDNSGPSALTFPGDFDINNPL